MKLHYQLTLVIKDEENECRVLSFLQWSRLLLEEEEQAERLSNIEDMFYTELAA